MEIFEGFQVPIFSGPSPSFNIPSGGVELYCDNCYNTMKSQIPEDKNELDFNEVIPIKEITFGLVNKKIKVVGKLLSFSKKEIQKYNRPLILTECKIKDNTGEIDLNLWNHEKELNKNSIYYVEGFVKEYLGKVSISIGYQGVIKKIE